MRKGDRRNEDARARGPLRKTVRGSSIEELHKRECVLGGGAGGRGGDHKRVPAGGSAR